MRRLPIAGGVLVALAALLALVAPAAATPSGAPEGFRQAAQPLGGAAPNVSRRIGETGAPDGAQDSTVDVIEVSGLLDPVLVDFIDGAVGDAERSGSVALVLQLDSSGAVVSDDALSDLAERLAGADVQIGIWVGPSGSSAYGGSAQLLGVADVVGVAPGSRVGRTGDLVLAGDDYDAEFLDLADRLEEGTIGADDAIELGLAAGPAPIVGEFILDLDGVESRVVGQGAERRREPLSTVRFGQLPLGSQLLHTVASPAVAYLLFAAGMALVLFELFTAGIGVAGVVGAGSFLLGCYGLAVLPTTTIGPVLLVGSMLAFGIDVQTGVPRVWTGVGLVAFVAGSFALYDGVSLSWITLLSAIVGVALAMLAGMPAMVRTRFSTPTIGREWMIGEAGHAVAAVDPDGVVRVRDALWRARTNRATPVGVGEAVRVVGIEGLLLEVEPEEGGARDHRERRQPDLRSGADAATKSPGGT